MSRDEWIARLVGIRIKGERIEAWDNAMPLMEGDLKMPPYMAQVVRRALPHNTKTLYGFLTDLDPETDPAEGWREMCLWVFPRIAEDAKGDERKPATTRWTLFYRDRDYLMTCYEKTDLHRIVGNDIDYYLRERKRRIEFRGVIRGAYQCRPLPNRQ